MQMVQKLLNTSNLQPVSVPAFVPSAYIPYTEYTPPAFSPALLFVQPQPPVEVTEPEYTPPVKVNKDGISLSAGSEIIFDNFLTDEFLVLEQKFTAMLERCFTCEAASARLGRSTCAACAVVHKREIAPTGKRFRWDRW